MGVPSTVVKRGQHTMPSPCAPTTHASTAAGSQPSFSHTANDRREESSTPPMPMRRSAGRPLSRNASVVMTSSGFVTQMNTAFGDASRAWPITDFMMPAFTPSRSSRVMPGLRAMPAVMTTTSESRVSA